MIQDSGERRKFDSGAVRDIQEGKGRMDLLPLNQISEFIEYYNTTVTFTYGSAFSFIKAYINTRNCCAIYACIKQFMDEINLSLYDMIIELSKHYEEGALKYEDRNWEKGIPMHCFVDSGLRHYTKYLRGDTDERHDRAFLWNMFGLIWTYNNHPECDDLPKPIL